MDKPSLLFDCVLLVRYLYHIWLWRDGEIELDT